MTLSREELDAFSAQSQQRAAVARDEGRFDNEIIAVKSKVYDRESGNVIESDELVTADEGIREGTTAESLAKLKPAFKEDGKVTAGNSSQITDGASAVLIMSEEKANQLGLKPRARFHSFAVTGVDPIEMLTGPIPATTQVLKKAGLSLDDIDLVEINEAFASVVLAWEKEHKPDMSKVNVNGGAIALGHPLGCSGTKLHGHPAQRARAHRRPLRPPDHVRGRRHGQRHDHRAAVVGRGTRGSRARLCCPGRLRRRGNVGAGPSPGPASVVLGLWPRSAGGHGGAGSAFPTALAAR